MPEISQLMVTIGADTADLSRGLQQANQQVEGFGSSLKSGLGMGLAFSAIQTGIGLVGSAFSAAKGSVIDLNSSLEQSKIAFTTMLGGAEQADAFLADLQQFAATTPFEFPDLVQASKRMLAFGFEAKNVRPLLTAVGDAVAAVGGGADVIDGVTTALGQMQAKGKVSAEEMAQLAERGIPAWDMLAKKMGVSVADAMKMVSNGGVEASTFIQAFQEGTAERFGGMMEKQSQTFQGAMSTITDSLSMATATAFKPFFDLVSQGALWLSQFVQSDTFNAWAGAVSGSITLVADAVRGLVDIFLGGDDFDRVGELLDNFFPHETANGIMALVANVGDVFKAVFKGDIPLLIEAVTGIFNNFGQIISGAVESWATAFAGWVATARPKLMANLGGALVGVSDWLLDSALAIVEKLGTWAAAFVDWIGPMIPDQLRALGGVLVAMTTWLVDDALPTILGKLAEWGLAFVEWVAPRIPPLLAELGKLLVDLGSWLLTDALPAILTRLAKWGLAFVEWVAPKVGPLLLELGKLLISLGSWIATDAAPAVIDKLLTWGAAFVDWVGPKIPLLLVQLGLLLTNLGTWIVTTAAPAIVEKLITWGAAFLGFVARDVLPKLPETLLTILTAVGTWVGEKAAAFGETVADLGKGVVTGIRDGISGALSGFWSWLQESFVDKIPGFVKDLLGIHSPSGVFADIGRNIVDGLRVGMEAKLPSIDDVIERLVGRIASSGDVSDWLQAAMHVAGVSGSWLHGLERLVRLESSGNPHAVNSTAVNGEHASGLLQTLPSTFSHYRNRDLPNDIFNPIANAVAAIRYISDTYGHVNEIPGLFNGEFRGYATGGIAWGPQLAMVGEREPEAIIPRSWFGRSGSAQTIHMPITIGGRVVEDIYVTGRELAIRRGRVPAGAV